MRTVTYRSENEILHPDTCGPVRAGIASGKMVFHALARNDYPGEPLRSGEIPGISSLGEWFVSGEDLPGLASHRNEGIELTVCLKGHSPVTVDEAHRTLGPNQIMITRPWQRHSIGSPCFAKGRIAWLILDVGVRHPHQEWIWPPWILLRPAELKSLTHALRQNEDPIRPVTPSFSRIFAETTELAAAPELRHRGTLLAIQINRLLLELFSVFEEKPARYTETLTGTERTIRLFLSELPNRLKAPWSVESMAEACGIGVTLFTRLFAEITGQTPARYLLSLRLEAACKRLVATDRTIAEIATQAGFSSAGYFTKVFFRRFGRTPLDYRKNPSPEHRTDR